MREPIDVDLLTRVEGEGSIHLRFGADGLDAVEFRIGEAPRMFEALLVGRSMHEVPDIVARICGICPVAHQVTACLALEAGAEVEVPEATRRLRDLLYLGEWISSHALHLFLLEVPDHLGVPDVFHLARDNPRLVEDGFALKKLGDALAAAVGGRAVHPVNVRPGGFFTHPDRAGLCDLVPRLEEGLERMERHLDALVAHPLPELSRPLPHVAVRGASGYPLSEGWITSTGGSSIPASGFSGHFAEHQVPGSNALHCRLDGQVYATGPLARLLLGFDRLLPRARSAARRMGFTPNDRLALPFWTGRARAVEILHALEAAQAAIEAGIPTPAAPSAPWPPGRPGSGAAATEAPRGMLVHRYTWDDAGRILTARIVPPTSQNLGAIEADLRALGPRLLAGDRDAAVHLAERAVRNHDPCISCATHLVTVDWGEARPARAR